jgi:hypothetical protein
MIFMTFVTADLMMVERKKSGPSRSESVSAEFQSTS